MARFLVKRYKPPGLTGWGLALAGGRGLKAEGGAFASCFSHFPHNPKQTKQNQCEISWLDAAMVIFFKLSSIHLYLRLFPGFTAFFSLFSCGGAEAF